MAPASKPTRRYFANSPFQADPPSAPAEEYAVADRVHHDRHGLGEVVSVEGDSWITARFATGLVRIPNDKRVCKLE